MRVFPLAAKKCFLHRLDGTDCHLMDLSLPAKLVLVSLPEFRPNVLFISVRRREPIEPFNSITINRCMKMLLIGFVYWTSSDSRSNHLSF